MLIATGLLGYGRELSDGIGSEFATYEQRTIFALAQTLMADFLLLLGALSGMHCKCGYVCTQ